MPVQLTGPAFLEEVVKLGPVLLPGEAIGCGQSVVESLGLVEA